MSRSKTPDRTRNGKTRTWQRALHAARLQPAADQVMPVARSAGAAAKRQANRTRSWAAPQVERAGQAVQDSIAPKVSSLLSAAARRLEPGVPRRRRWRKLAGFSAVTAAAGAAAAAVRSHLKAGAGATAAPDQAKSGETAPAAQTAPAMETGDGQRSTSSDAGQNSEVRTS
jgi:hypothetical protein